MPFQVVFSPASESHLKALPMHDRRLVLEQGLIHLSHQPLRPSKRRKRMEANPYAEWELLLGDHRVYYNVDEKGPGPTVYIIAVGHKIHNRVYIGGEEVRF